MAPLPPITFTPRQVLSSIESNLESIKKRMPDVPTPTFGYLLRRQTTEAPTATVTVVSPGNNGGDAANTTNASTLSGGAIAGIVIGSIAGFLLLWWILRSFRNLGSPEPTPPGAQPWYGNVRDEPHHHHHRHHHHSRSPSGHRRRSSVEVRQVPVVVAGSPRQPKYVYERDGRRHSRHGRHHSRSRSRT